MIADLHGAGERDSILTGINGELRNRMPNLVSGLGTDGGLRTPKSAR